MSASATSLADAGTPLPVHPFELYCEVAAERGLQLTPLRLTVLGALWRSQLPVATYSLAAQLSRTGPNRTYPNSVHRTLQTLADTGLVIPVVSWKRFLISPDPLRSAWLINLCSGCEAFTCVPAEQTAAELRSLCNQDSFLTRRLHLECIGRCRRCEPRNA